MTTPLLPVGDLPTAFINARLLDPARRLDRPGSVLVAAGRIAAVAPTPMPDGLPPDTRVVDCGGHCLAPGLVDLRAELREPGQEHLETFLTGSRAAAAGGITSLVCLPNTDPVIDEVALVDYVRRRVRETGLVHIYPAAAATRGLRGDHLTEIGLLQESGAVLFTDGVQAIAGSLIMRRLLAYARGFDALIMQHPEDPQLAAGGAMNEGETAARLGLAGIPAVAEIVMVERDLRLLEATGGRLHIGDVSTAASLAAIRKAKAAGLRVTCDTAPPYFALTEVAVGDYRTYAKLSPPLRGQADREAVIAGLRDGTIDAVASDHAPHDSDSKRLPFAQAAFGAVGLELVLPLLLERVHGGDLPLLDALALVSCRPAAILGLPAGRLDPGLPADLVLFDLDRAWRFDAATLHSKAKNTPFDGRPLQGRVLKTIVAGRVVFDATTA